MRFRRGCSVAYRPGVDRRGASFGVPGSFGPGMAIGGGGGLHRRDRPRRACCSAGSTAAGWRVGHRAAGRGRWRRRSKHCETGADANQQQDCALVAVVNSVQEYWSGAVDGYRPAETVLFDGQVATACGNATSAVGPFYCPADEHVYIDLSFYDELTMSSARRAASSPRRTSSRTSTATTCSTCSAPTRASATIVKGRSRARCGSSSRPTATRVCGPRTRSRPRLIAELTNDDIQRGLDAAAAVGDDRIQERAQGQVDRESWTHGSARQRQRWFTIGYRTRRSRASATRSRRTRCERAEPGARRASLRGRYDRTAVAGRSCAGARRSGLRRTLYNLTPRQIVAERPVREPPEESP